jgi:CheY-like chemotaxis protein
MGYINILRQSENIKDKEKEQLKIIYNSSNILFQLVNDILDFSKIEVGKLSLIEKEFNVKEMINNAVNMIGIMAKEKQLEFLVHIDGEIPTYIFGDERRLEQVLINIMSNAVKFTQEGHIKLYIEARYFDDKVKMDFIVSDTGKGMDADKLDKIFEAFQQEDNSISKDYGGTGLGLYISRDFIKRMNGDIKVISNAGQGSKFEFYTIHRVGNQEDISGSNILKEGISDEIKGKKILVVEDNEVNQLMIRDILMNMELTVVLANNGVEAIEIANKYFDFILMDIQMPKMDGISAVKLLKQNEDLKEIPIIAFSANAMPEQIKTYIKAGFDGYCTKPIIIKDLQRVLIEAHKNSCKIDTIRIY